MSASPIADQRQHNQYLTRASRHTPEDLAAYRVSRYGRYLGASAALSLGDARRGLA